MKLTDLQIACLQRLADAAADPVHSPMTDSGGAVRSSVDGRHGTVVGSSATSLETHGLATVERTTTSTWYRITDAGRLELEAQRERLAKRAARSAGRLNRSVAR